MLQNLSTRKYHFANILSSVKVLDNARPDNVFVVSTDEASSVLGLQGVLNRSRKVLIEVLLTVIIDIIVVFL